MNELHDFLDQVAICEEEHLWRDLFNVTNEAIFVHDAATCRVLDLNDRALEMFGYSREEFLRTNLMSRPFAGPPFSAKDARAWIRKAAESGPQVFEWQACNKNGDAFWCEISLRKTLLADRECVLAVARDITGHKQAEERLRNSESLYQSLVENLPQLIFRKDLKGRFTFANQHFCQRIGKSLEEILGKTDAELSPPDLAAKYLEEDLLVIESGKSIEMEEEHHSNKMGRYYVWVVKTPLCDAQGNIIGVQGIVMDITSQKRAEAALAEREKRYRSLFDLSPSGIVLEDIKGNMLEVNPAMCRIFGYSREELCGHNVRMLVPPEFQKEIDLSFDDLVAGKTLLHEFENIGKDGSPRRVEIHEMTVPLEDGSRGILAVVNDITQRRQLEEQLRHLQKMESVGQLAAGVAHDFNNILTVINGSASFLSELLKDQPDLLDWVIQIQTAGEKAANLTRQLLLFSNKRQMQPASVQLNELTGNLTKMLGCVLGEGITLECSFENELPVVQGDAGMLEQVIINLAVNARDAMTNGGRLQIATSSVNCTTVPPTANPTAGPGRYVRLAVRDSGTGIPPEIRERIFEPFFTTKDVGKGTGLGLATVFGIVAQHRGWLEVESEVGHGSMFCVYLPAAASSDLDSSGHTTAASLRGHGETVLLVEDEASVRELISRALQQYGYKILLASSGADARNLPSQELAKVDVLVTDIVIPGGMNGRELADSLRSLYPEISVIYCSGYSPDDAGGWGALDSGAHFIQKPFSPRELLIAIAERLRS